MTIKSLFISFTLVLLLAFSAFAEHHPHLFVTNAEKSAILEKIKQQPWAAKIFQSLKEKVDPYVERHQHQPDWILSRYLMNRAPGKRYTHFYSDPDGTQLVKFSGDAPVPTVRVSPHKRIPLTKNGFKYIMPTIEELVPYDTATLMHLQSTEPGKGREWVNPQSFVSGINSEINQLVLDAAIVYWLTGQEKYARFAADVLDQWARGAAYQNPIEGACRCGFLDIQTLGDRISVPMILAYDFLYDYLREKHFEMRCYETVFSRIASTLITRGYTNNNWFAAETPALVLASLSLEDQNQKEHFLSYFLSKDTVDGGCGQLSLPTATKRWFTTDGHWKEPGGYHNFPVGSLIWAALAMEKNGYPLFEQYPTLFNSAFVMLKYSFPNYKASSFGDTGRPSQSPEMLEIAIAMAAKYHLPILDQLTASMDVLIANQQYQRDQSGYLGLLCFLPELPKTTATAYQWPRSGTLDFASCYLQRNGTNVDNGLMYVVQGATYNHNHANGMSMELYGAGYNMGIDPGNGPTYESPMHVNYYTEFAAHNTVTGAAASAPTPLFTGGGGAKNMGAITLAAMEPKAGAAAVSQLCSFTDTRYLENSTNTRQQRTMAIVRTSDSTGYYVDIFRSDNLKSNEYLYHNIGNEVTMFDSSHTPLQLTPAEFPMSCVPMDPPGFRCIHQYRSTGKVSKPVQALFSLKENPQKPAFMQVLYPGEQQREFYTAMAPAATTAQAPYNTMLTPMIICRQTGEAWSRPFVAIYEPFIGANGASVTQVERIDSIQTAEFSALRVTNRNSTTQLILQDVKGMQLRSNTGWSFKGNFGVIGLTNNRLNYLYLGAGSRLSFGGYSLSVNTSGGAANATVKGNSLIVSSNQPVEVGMPYTGKLTATLETGAIHKTLKGVRRGNQIIFSVEAASEAIIDPQ